jgi:hypothetical protein
LGFSNVDFSGGFAAHYADTAEDKIILVALRSSISCIGG